MAELTDTERQMLTFALGLAQEKIWSEDGFTEDDQKAVDRLRVFTVDGRTAHLEHAVVQARYALASLCHDLEDPGTGALGALYIVSQASAGAPAQYKDETQTVLAEHEAKIIDMAADEVDSVFYNEPFLSYPPDLANRLREKARERRNQK